MLKLPLATLLTALCLGQITGIVLNKPANAQAVPTTYETAKKELPEDFYVVYRITERLARANGLDKMPWRIVVIEEYNMNAFATDQNLIAIYHGLLDQVEGDPSAIACVVAHEMAHHTEKHIALSQSEQKAMVEKFTEEARIEVMREAEDARNDATGAAIGGALLQGIGSFFGGIGSTAGNTVGGVLGGAAQQRIADAEVRIQQIVESKQAALEAEIAENNRRQEYEADEYGYKYMAKAGFDGDGCLRLMDVMARIPGSDVDTTHPATRKRIDQIQTLMVENPPETLAGQGELMLKTSRPLTYSLSRDGNSLRINSQNGSTTDAIDRMF